MQDATLQIFGYIEQLVDNADTQIQQITKATEEVMYVSDSNHKIAERAQKLYYVAHEARQAANRGRQAVQQTMRGMERINANVDSTSRKVHSLGDRSREIGTIVEVISGLIHTSISLCLCFSPLSVHIRMTWTKLLQ